jgi:hypothetical protein
MMVVMAMVMGAVFVVVIVRVMIMMVMRMIIMVIVMVIVMGMVVMTMLGVSMVFVGTLFPRLSPFSSRLAFAAGLGGGRLRFAACAPPCVTFFFLALVAFLFRDQAFAVGDGDLIVVGVNFTKGQEPVTVPAVIDESGL